MAEEEPISAERGVQTVDEARAWLSERGIEDIECIVPDQAGVARGKMMPAGKFFSGASMTMPSAVFRQTIAGDYPEENQYFRYDPRDGDLVFRPDYSTLSVVPWESDPTAQLIHDAYERTGEPFSSAPRQVLRSVVDHYTARGWRPVVAPEIEFYLIKPNVDPDYPLEPPIGRSGRPESGRKSYSISALNEFDEVIDDIYDFSEKQGLEIDTLIHEEGKAQMEINLRHGDPVTLADQVFLFKRTIREAALRHNMYATFMAKPMTSEPGSAMHIHQSVVNAATGESIFSAPDGSATPLFRAFVAGQQRYLPHAMAMLAPYVNSYRRLARGALGSPPINLHWGHDNRTVGLRVPTSSPAARRLENRVPGSDSNPYLAIAASLACGYLGMVGNLSPDDPIDDWGHDLPYGLPRSLNEALEALTAETDLVELLGRTFVYTYKAIKEGEYETFMRVISPWEREHLLLSV
ncbi:MAG: glutamine synthetase [Devosiaceae bacterium]|nr:glutamine synthetase [Devosiaceae bacterium MH13]